MGGNDLLKVIAVTGAVSLVASLAGQTSTGQQAVPVAVGPDGELYVSLLTGYPFPNGGAKVVGSTVTDFATGLTLLTDIKVGPNSQIYALSLGKSDITLTPPYVPNSGSVVRLKADGSKQVVLDELNFPLVLAFNAGGDAFINKNGLGAPGSGQILKYPKLTQYTAK